MIRLATWIVLSLLALPVFPQDAEEKGTTTAEEPADVVKDAAAKLGKAKNYSYAYEPNIDSGDGMLARFTKRFSADTTGVVDIEKDVFTAKSDRLELARKGDKVAVKIRGEWQDAEDVENQRTQMMVDALADRKAPHDQAAAWLKKAEELKEEENKKDVDGKSCRVFTGKLTEEAAEEALIEPLAAFADQLGAEIEDPEGTASFYVDEEGYIRKFVLKASGSLGVSFQGMEQSFDLEAEYSTTISKIDKTELELADEAKEILGLEGDTDDKKEEDDDE